MLCLRSASGDNDSEQGCGNQVIASGTYWLTTGLLRCEIRRYRVLCWSRWQLQHASIGNQLEGNRPASHRKVNTPSTGTGSCLPHVKLCPAWDELCEFAPFVPIYLITLLLVGIKKHKGISRCMSEQNLASTTQPLHASSYFDEYGIFHLVEPNALPPARINGRKRRYITLLERPLQERLPLQPSRLPTLSLQLWLSDWHPFPEATLLCESICCPQAPPRLSEAAHHPASKCRQWATVLPHRTPDDCSWASKNTVLCKLSHLLCPDLALLPNFSCRRLFVLTA